VRYLAPILIILLLAAPAISVDCFATLLLYGIGAFLDALETATGQLTG
jgi:hypothetical protein